MQTLEDKFDGLVDLVDEALLFVNERLRRVSPPVPEDHGRLTDLHNRLRALKGTTDV